MNTKSALPTSRGSEAFNSIDKALLLPPLLCRVLTILMKAKRTQGRITKGRRKKANLRRTKHVARKSTAHCLFSCFLASHILEQARRRRRARRVCCPLLNGLSYNPSRTMFLQAYHDVHDSICPQWQHTSSGNCFCTPCHIAIHICFSTSLLRVQRALRVSTSVASPRGGFFLRRPVSSKLSKLVEIIDLLHLLDSRAAWRLGSHVD